MNLFGKYKHHNIDNSNILSAMSCCGKHQHRRPGSNPNNGVGAATNSIPGATQGSLQETVQSSMPGAGQSSMPVAGQGSMQEARQRSMPGAGQGPTPTGQGPTPAGQGPTPAGQGPTPTGQNFGGGREMEVFGTVGLLPGTTIGISQESSVGIRKNAVLLDGFDSVAMLTAQNVSYNEKIGGFVSNGIAVSEFQQYTWFVYATRTTFASASASALSLQLQYNPIENTTDSKYWTSQYYTFTENAGEALKVNTVNLNLSTGVFIDGKLSVGYSRILVTVAGAAAGDIVTMAAALEGFK